jgi:hypothetical protein
VSRPRGLSPPPHPPPRRAPISRDCVRADERRGREARTRGADERRGRVGGVATPMPRWLSIRQRELTVCPLPPGWRMRSRGTAGRRRCSIVVTPRRGPQEGPYSAAIVPPLPRGRAARMFVERETLSAWRWRNATPPTPESIGTPRKDEKRSPRANEFH